jgi:hypothetical protein
MKLLLFYTFARFSLYILWKILFLHFIVRLVWYQAHLTKCYSIFRKALVTCLTSVSPIFRGLLLLLWLQSPSFSTTFHWGELLKFHYQYWTLTDKFSLTIYNYMIMIPVLYVHHLIGRCLINNVSILIHFNVYLYKI